MRPVVRANWRDSVLKVDSREGSVREEDETYNVVPESAWSLMSFPIRVHDVHS